ncbi:hypothetical protein [Nocardia transvalensis]|uniref:hypothetical protein n=1 Tax=Nocardia transvalensis TaxID=37333 RepID=UPI00189407FB|nr:hypothetical protein [Nocardia transvalensis]MBF6327455.1 hypothetical protein [Nocardia transvalensis]
MTRSDSGGPGKDQGNPFDLGLPMLRTPERKPSRRRRSGRRPVRRGNQASAVPEPLPGPQGSSYPSGEWERWLDPSPVPQREPIAAPGERVHHASEYDATDDPADKSDLIPVLIDRSGGNPGARLRHPRRPRRDNRRGDKVVAALIVLGLGVVVVSIVLTVIHTGKRAQPATATKPVPVHTSVPGTAAVGVPTAVPNTIAADGCQQRRTADVVSGTDPGGTGSGPDAILAFERAYYVQRSGFAARAVVADDATVRTAEEIQRGINQVPVGTRYCVQITRAGDEGQWEVRLTEQRPDEQPRTFTQIITTRTIATRTLITAIHAG